MKPPRRYGAKRPSKKQVAFTDLLYRRKPQTDRHRVDIEPLEGVEPGEPIFED